MVDDWYGSGKTNADDTAGNWDEDISNALAGNADKGYNGSIGAVDKGAQNYINTAVTAQNNYVDKGISSMNDLVDKGVNSANEIFYAQMVDKVLSTDKGYRPDPFTYMSDESINNHLALFNNGVTRIQQVAPTRPLGSPLGTFVMPKSIADDLISDSYGEISKLERLLGLEPGELGDAPVRVDIQNTTGLRMPTGNEVGANLQWIPRGYTTGGIPEAIIDQVPLEHLTVTKIFQAEEG